MTYGLLSALCWGVSALVAAAAARRIGACYGGVIAVLSVFYCTKG